MTPGTVQAANKPQASDAEKVCDLILQIAGRDTNRLPSVRRHVSVLQGAMAYMSKHQAEVARARIERFSDKWGHDALGIENAPANEELEPEMRVAVWLAMRRNPERLLMIPYRAAVAIWDGKTRLSDIMNYAYARELDMLIHMVGYDSFREMLFQLRIAVRTDEGDYRPGSLCQWWVKEMTPTGRPDSSWAACLKLAEELKLSKTRRCSLRHRRKSRLKVPAPDVEA